MGGAGNAGIIIPNGLLTLPLELVIRQMEVRRNKLPKVVFDAFLIDRRRRYNLCILNDSPIIDRITMVTNSPRRFRTPIAGSRTGLNINGRRIRFLILLQ